MPASKAPNIDKGLTLEGWVAIAAYPWNWAPIVHQGDDDGYLLGIDGHGRPGLKLKVGTRQSEIVADQRLGVLVTRIRSMESMTKDADSR